MSGVIDAFVDDLAAYKISHGFSKGTVLTQTRYPYYINYIYRRLFTVLSRPCVSLLRSASIRESVPVTKHPASLIPPPTAVMS